MKKTLLAMAMAIALALSMMAPAMGSTVVPGHQDRDDTVVGKYTAVYAWDAEDDYYFDLGDGRVDSSDGIDSIDDLEQGTLSVCDYQVQYRGDFEGTPFLASGWIMNNITCDGHAYDNAQTYTAVYVHKSDPRYTGEGEPIWTTWEVHLDVVGGEGNLANKGVEQLIE